MIARWFLSGGNRVCVVAILYFPFHFRRRTRNATIYLYLYQMKPTIHFECTNEQCSTFERPVSLPDRSFIETQSLDREENKKESFMRHRYCPECLQQQGKLSIKHGNQHFQDFREYEQHIENLIETSKLLNRLVSAGVGTSQDIERLSKNKEYLTDAKCPTCGGAALDALEDKHIS